jgi:hypothetical protein
MHTKPALLKKEIFNATIRQNVHVRLYPVAHYSKLNDQQKEETKKLFCIRVIIFNNKRLSISNSFVQYAFFFSWNFT